MLLLYAETNLNLILEQGFAFFLVIHMVLKVTSYMIWPPNLVLFLEMSFSRKLFFHLNHGFPNLSHLLHQSMIICFLPFLVFLISPHHLILSHFHLLIFLLNFLLRLTFVILLCHLMNSLILFLLHMFFLMFPYVLILHLLLLKMLFPLGTLLGSISPPFTFRTIIAILPPLQSCPRLPSLPHLTPLL